MSHHSTDQFLSRRGHIEKRSRSAPYLLLLGAGVVITIASLIGMSYGEAWHPRASARQEVPAAEIVSLVIVPVATAKLVEAPLDHRSHAAPAPRH